MVEIVVTGMAWNTALGSNLFNVWDKLLDNKTGIQKKQTNYQVKNSDGHNITDNDCKNQYVPREMRYIL